MILAEAAGDVFFGELMLWVGEDLCGFPDFDQMAQMEERGSLRNAGGLLHRMGHDDDGVKGPKFINQLLNFSGCNRVKG